MSKIIFETSLNLISVSNLFHAVVCIADVLVIARIYSTNYFIHPIIFLSYTKVPNITL